MSENIDWAAEVERITQAYIAGGTDPDVARRGAEAEVAGRQDVAGTSGVVTFPGAPIEDAEGNPLGVSIPRSMPVTFDEQGRPIAGWQE